MLLFELKCMYAPIKATQLYTCTYILYTLHVYSCTCTVSLSPASSNYNVVFTRCGHHVIRIVQQRSKVIPAPSSDTLQFLVRAGKKSWPLKGVLTIHLLERKTVVHVNDFLQNDQPFSHSARSLSNTCTCIHTL